VAEILKGNDFTKINKSKKEEVNSSYYKMSEMFFSATTAGKKVYLKSLIGKQIELFRIRI
jgi:hypothetical protein